MTGFAPYAASVGGLMIGASAALLWLGLGRIAGISGIVGGLAAAPAGDRLWRAAFLIGLIAAPALYGLAAPAPVPVIAASTPVMVLGGLLVGFGTRLGGGCTSGHGVCGLSRLSPRSLVATLVFCSTAAATVFVTHHLIGG